ncbi:hypothetical protein KIN38_17220 [Vibrio sp. B511a]|uniref:hypothetical protein n=1 Tax=Vibrio sp. B511a TaxID=2835905 RepID=UPI002557397F|nr:hypothetical protein [Vibrio sp. B511a]EJC6854971.1 hypothetical protein [Vibrio parahaemolyticus]MDK9734470.1 hypothetical protein [Vibrio sp. B511a]
MEIKPVEQIIALFDISALVNFFVVAAGVILGFALAKKAFEMTLNLIDEGRERRIATQAYMNGLTHYEYNGQKYNIAERYEIENPLSDSERRSAYNNYQKQNYKR